MRLFAEQGFAATTIDQIAEAADVSRATVFSYFPTKEDIVFGDARAAVDALAARAARARRAAGDDRRRPRAGSGELAGWIEPELVLQLRLAREVPIVGARRLQLYGDDRARRSPTRCEAELGPERSSPRGSPPPR